MHDVNGYYYYPDPSDVKSRVYVRQGIDDAEFRLWHSEHPEAWERHGWVPYSMIQKLAAMYKEQGSGSDPLALYDINVALALIKEQERNRRKQAGE